MSFVVRPHKSEKCASTNVTPTRKEWAEAPSYNHVACSDTMLINQIISKA